MISLNFIANRGWTQGEFNAIFTRELVELGPPFAGGSLMASQYQGIY